MDELTDLEVQMILRWLKHLELDCKLTAEEKRPVDHLHEYYLAQKNIVSDIIEGIENGQYKNWRLR